MDPKQNKGEKVPAEEPGQRVPTLEQAEEESDQPTAGQPLNQPAEAQNSNEEISAINIRVTLRMRDIQASDSRATVLPITMQVETKSKDFETSSKKRKLETISKTLKKDAPVKKQTPQPAVPLVSSIDGQKCSAACVQGVSSVGQPPLPPNVINRAPQIGVVQPVQQINNPPLPLTFSIPNIAEIISNPGIRRPVSVIGVDIIPSIFRHAHDNQQQTRFNNQFPYMQLPRRSFRFGLIPLRILAVQRSAQSPSLFLVQWENYVHRFAWVVEDFLKNYYRELVFQFYETICDRN